MDVASPWIDALFAAIDRKDHEAFCDFLLPNARFRYGNNAYVSGGPAIAATVAEFFAALNRIEHRIGNRWIVPDAAIVTGAVTYTRHDGSELEVPFANILRLLDGKISEYLIFVDNSALFAEAGDVTGRTAPASAE